MKENVASCSNGCDEHVTQGTINMLLSFFVRPPLQELLAFSSGMLRVSAKPEAKCCSYGGIRKTTWIKKKTKTKQQ